MQSKKRLTLDNKEENNQHSRHLFCQGVYWMSTLRKSYCWCNLRYQIENDSETDSFLLNTEAHTDLLDPFHAALLRHIHLLLHLN